MSTGNVGHDSSSELYNLCAIYAKQRSEEEHLKWGPVVGDAECMPESAFTKLYGEPATNNFKRKTSTHGFRTYENYSSHTFNDPEGVQHRVLSRFDELISLDPANASLIVRPDKRILRTGTIVPGGIMRDKYGLKSAADDAIYFDNLKYICLSMMEGVVLAYRDLDTLRASSIRVSLPLDRGKGTGFEYATGGEYNDFCAGPDANFAMSNIVFPAMLAHADGIFMYENIVAPNATGYRCQNPTIQHVDTGEYHTKWRYSVAFDQNFVLRECTHWEPSDGDMGMRVRLINNVSTVKQLPTVVVDKIFMSNLPKRLKTILKATPEQLAAECIGGTVVDTDFGQFENTQEEITRTYIAKTLFSDRIRELIMSIDNQDLIGCYIDDLNSSDGSSAQRLYWRIRKSASKEVQKKFDVLLSGIGVTTVYGKILGMAEIGTIFCRSLGHNAKDFWGYPGKESCPASILIRNCGDDCRSLAHHVRAGDVNHDKGTYHKWFEAHFDHILNDKRYVMDVEGLETGGGSYIGQRVYNVDGMSPANPDHVVGQCSVSHSRYLANSIQKESTIGSKFRPESLEMTSLYGSIESAYRSMVVHGGHEESFWHANTELMLDLIGINATVDQIRIAAEEEEKFLMSQLGSWEMLVPILKKKQADITKEESTILEMSRGLITQQLMKFYSLKNPDELIWNVEREKIIGDFGEVVFSCLFLLLPEKLTADLSRFINIDTFEEVRKDLKNG